MQHRLQLGLFSAVFFLSTWIGAIQSVRAQSQPVSDVQVVGQRRIEADAIKEKMKIKSGVTPNADLVREDILSIFSLGWFEDVQIAQQGGKLLVQVRERPVVMSVLFEGADEFEDKDLEEAVAIKPFTVLNLGKIEAAKKALAQKYEEKGYYLAKIDHALKPSGERPGEMDLIFKVMEGDQVMVRKIFFLGNKKFPSDELKRNMITTEGHVFSFMGGGGTYREGAFDRDLAVLSYYYGNLGYIEAKFEKPRVTLSQDKRYIDVILEVTEGEQHFLGEVQFRGDLLFTTDELRAAFEMKKGEVFSVGKLQEQVLKLTDLYGDEGYAFANVIPRNEVNAADKTVQLIFEIEKGDKVYWNRIQVTGNLKTHDRVIRRELPFHEGELYNATKRKKGLERVRRLGFFGTEVNFLTSTPKGEQNKLDLEIRVKEKPTGSLNAQAGYGSGAGFTFGGMVSQANLFGLGHQAYFKVDLGQQVVTPDDRSTPDVDETKKKFQTTLTINYTNPRFNDSLWLLGGDLSISDIPVTGYKLRQSSGVLRTGRELSDELSLSGSYRLANNDTSAEVNPAVFTSTLDQDGVLSVLGLGLAYDSRNNRLDPTDGVWVTANMDLGGLGGRVYQKLGFAHRTYRKLFWKFVWRQNIEYGLLANVLNDDTVPDIERYRLGGIFNLRGYPMFDVGPRRSVDNFTRPITAADGSVTGYEPLNFVLGGTQKFQISQEVEFTLIPEADIRVVFFIDAGNAFEGGLGSLRPGLLANYGWGIRWYSPMGALRFEFGTPLFKRDGAGDRTQPNFFIGPSF